MEINTFDKIKIMGYILAIDFGIIVMTGFITLIAGGGFWFGAFIGALVSILYTLPVIRLMFDTIIEDILS